MLFLFLFVIMELRCVLCLLYVGLIVMCGWMVCGDGGCYVGVLVCVVEFDYCDVDCDEGDIDGYYC